MVRVRFDYILMGLKSLQAFAVVCKVSKNIVKRRNQATSLTISRFETLEGIWKNYGRKVRKCIPVCPVSCVTDMSPSAAGRRRRRSCPGAGWHSPRPVSSGAVCASAAAAAARRLHPRLHAGLGPGSVSCCRRRCRPRRSPTVGRTRTENTTERYGLGGSGGGWLVRRSETSAYERSGANAALLHRDFFGPLS